MPDAYVVPAMLVAVVAAMVVAFVLASRKKASPELVPETQTPLGLLPAEVRSAPQLSSLSEDEKDAAFEAAILKAQTRPLEQYFYSKLAGVQYPNDDGTSRVDVLSTCSPGEPLELRLEIGNRFDPNAVAVLYAGKQVGFLGSDVAREMRQRETVYGVYLRKFNRHPNTQAVVGANILILVYKNLDEIESVATNGKGTFKLTLPEGLEPMDLNPTGKWRSDAQRAQLREIFSHPPYMDFLCEFVKPHVPAFFDADPSRNWSAFLNAPHWEIALLMVDARLLQEVGKDEFKWKLTSGGALLVAKNAQDEAVRVKARKLL